MRTIILDFCKRVPIRFDTWPFMFNSKESLSLPTSHLSAICSDVCQVFGSNGGHVQSVKRPVPSDNSADGGKNTCNMRGAKASSRSHPTISLPKDLPILPSNLFLLNAEPQNKWQRISSRAAPFATLGNSRWHNSNPHLPKRTMRLHPKPEKPHCLREFNSVRAATCRRVCSPWSLSSAMRLTFPWPSGVSQDSLSSRPPPRPPPLGPKANPPCSNRLMRENPKSQKKVSLTTCQSLTVI